MDLNNINLTTQQIVDLYNTVLVETNNIDVEKQTFSFLGKNKKNIAVVVKYDDAVFLPDEQLNFLMNILGACNLNLTDVAIVNDHTHKISYEKLTEQLNTKTILLFDVDPLSIDLPINFPHFQIQHFNGLTFLYSPSLQEIENNKDLKKQLWTSLKKIFGI